MSKNILVSHLFEGEEMKLNIEKAKELIHFPEGDFTDEGILQTILDMVAKTDLSEEIQLLNVYGPMIPPRAVLERSKITEELVKVETIRDTLVESLASSAFAEGYNGIDMLNYLSGLLTEETVLEIFNESLYMQSSVLSRRLAAIAEGGLDTEEEDEAIESYNDMLDQARKFNTIAAINININSLIEDYLNLFNLPLLASKGVADITVEKIMEIPYIQYVRTEDVVYSRNAIQYSETQGVITEVESIKQMIDLTHIEAAMSSINRAALETLLSNIEGTDDAMDEVETMSPDNQ